MKGRIKLIEPIIGKRINLRDVEVGDAEFILSLRLDPELSRYLSSTVPDIEKQRAWIKEYKKRKNEWYFVIENKQHEPVGVIRIYDIRGDSFCWGSWIVIESARHYASFESLVLLYEHAFFVLNFTQTHFDARKNNAKAVNFYKRFGATIISEDDQNYYFHFSREQYKTVREKYAQIIQEKSC